MNQTDVINAELSAKETAAFKAGSAHDGQSYCAYLAKDGLNTHKITTWVGDTLATVITLKSGRIRNSFNTDTRGSFWARGIDGKLYHGRHNGVGMYCRMRLSKRQTR
jgi:hypothetical protein